MAAGRRRLVLMKAPISQGKLYSLFCDGDASRTTMSIGDLVESEEKTRFVIVLRLTGGGEVDKEDV